MTAVADAADAADVEATPTAADDAAVDDDAPAAEDAVADEGTARPSWAPWSSGPIAERTSAPADATPDGEPAGAAAAVEPAADTAPMEDPEPGVKSRPASPVAVGDPPASAAGWLPAAFAGEPPRADRLTPGSACAPVAGPWDEDAALGAPAAERDEEPMDVEALVALRAPAPPLAACDSSSRLG